MEDKHNPGNGVVSNWTHDDLRGIVRELPKDAKFEVERIIKKHEDVYGK